MKKNKKKEPKVKKDSYIKGVKSELKNVTWPSFKEIIKYTIATIVVCLILIAFFSILNLILSAVKGVFN